MVAAGPARRPARPPTRPSVRAVLFALLLGAAGGVAFFALGLPLPWMLGSMSATTAAALAGARIAVPNGLRAGLVGVLGVMLGSSFTPDLLQRLGTWSVSASGVLLYVVLCGVLVYLYMRRFANYGPVTSYFTAMPGGLNEMVALGSALGGDDRMIALSHAWRLTLVVFTIPFWFRFHEGYAPAARAFGGGFAGMAPLDLAVLVACGVGGFALARAVRLPAPGLTGAMVLSAAAHLGGLTASRMPPELVGLAQIGLGAALGCRFVGVDLRTVYRAMTVSTGGSVMMIGLTVASAVAIGRLTELPVPGLLLAFAPGGLAEMSLIALSLGLDAAFVSTHQLLRILVVILVAPLMFKLLAGSARLPLERPAAGDD
jgi:membrane AbrB-like protein